MDRLLGPHVAFGQSWSEQVEQKALKGTAKSFSVCAYLAAIRKRALCCQWAFGPWPDKSTREWIAEVTVSCSLWEAIALLGSSSWVPGLWHSTARGIPKARTKFQVLPSDLAPWDFQALASSNFRPCCCIGIQLRAVGPWVESDPRAIRFVPGKHS